MNTVVSVVTSTVVNNSCCYVGINALELYDTVSKSRVPWQRNTAQALSAVHICVMTKEFRRPNHNICICLQVKCPTYDTSEYFTYSCQQQFWVRCVFPVSLPGGHFEGEVSENRGHQTGDTHRSALWKLPWSVVPTISLCLLYYSILSSFHLISNLTTCPVLLQKRWPPTCATWGGWTSLRSPIMTTWGSSSLICSTGMAMSLTMNMTGSANHLWVPLTKSTHPPPTFPSEVPFDHRASGLPSFYCSRWNNLSLDHDWFFFQTLMWSCLYCGCLIF